MKDEIKVILDKLKDTADTSFFAVCGSQEELDKMPKSITKILSITSKDAKILLDHITNLQNGFKSTVEELCEITEKYEKLQKKYEKMKENAEILSKGYSDLEKRNEKAIELLKKFYDSGSCPLRNISMAYEILNGGDKDE